MSLAGAFINLSSLCWHSLLKMPWFINYLFIFFRKALNSRNQPNLRRGVVGDPLAMGSLRTPLPAVPAPHQPSWYVRNLSVQVKKGDLLLKRCWLTPPPPRFYIKLSSPPPVQQLDFHDSSPMFLRSSSLTSSNDEEDDGFLDVLDDNMEVSPCPSYVFMDSFFFSAIPFCQTRFLTSPICCLQNDSGVPMGMASLLTAPLVADSIGEDSVSVQTLAAVC